MRGAMKTQIVILRNKRASVKRRITNTIKKLNSSIEQFGRKAIIRGYVHILEECINEARVLNDRLVAVIPENEHEKALTWYDPIVRSNWVPGSIPGASKNPSSTSVAVWYWLG